jgi:glycosyltransferase involved in cell wall biosynthesis
VGPIELTIKGIDVALRAVSRLRSSGFDLKLFRASQMPLTPEETRLCASDHFVHLASVEEMRAWYRRLDLFIHASFPEEGLGLPPFEAMASGVPVVMTDIPSLSEIPDGAVLRAPPGDDAALASAAESILGDDAAWARQRAAGLEAARRFDVERVVARVERIFAGLEPPDVIPPGRRSRDRS